MKSFEDFLGKHPNVKYNNESSNNNAIKTKQNSIKEYKNIEEFDKAKTKVLKYVLYKKRTEQEIRKKFCQEVDENLLEDIIQNFKENGYINDSSYIQRAVNEFMSIKTLSIKEIYLKLYEKGININIIEEYFDANKDILEQYELSSAKKIIIKKSAQMKKEEIENFLYKKGYKPESIKLAFEEIEN